MADGDYEVGFGKPPQSRRFRPGQSGNPSGQRRARPSLAQRLDQILAEKVSVTEAGKSRLLAKEDIFLRQIVNKALSGDKQFSKLLLEYLERRQAGSSARAGTHADEFLMQELIGMLQASDAV